jgi:hypothetical protein
MRDLPFTNPDVLSENLTHKPRRDKSADISAQHCDSSSALNQIPRRGPT